MTNSTSKVIVNLENSIEQVLYITIIAVFSLLSQHDSFSHFHEVLVWLILAFAVREKLQAPRKIAVSFNFNQ